MLLPEKIDGKRAFQKSLSKIQFPLGDTRSRDYRFPNCLVVPAAAENRRQSSTPSIESFQKESEDWLGRRLQLVVEVMAYRQQRAGERGPFCELVSISLTHICTGGSVYAREPVQSVMLPWRGQHGHPRWPSFHPLNQGDAPAGAVTLTWTRRYWRANVEVFVGTYLGRFVS